MTTVGGQQAGADAAAYRLIFIDEQTPDLLPLSPVIAESVALSVGAGGAPPTIIIRRQAPYALLGPKATRLPSLNKGMAELKGAGLTVYERFGGRSAVVRDEGGVRVAAAKPWRGVGSADR